MKNQKKRDLFDASQVRRRLHISPPTLRKYIKWGLIKPIPRTGPLKNNRLLFRRGAIEEFAKIRPYGGFRRGPKKRPKSIDITRNGVNEGRRKNGNESRIRGICN